MAFFMFIYFLFTAIGLYSSSYVVYAFGFAIYVVLLIGMWPKLLYGYDLQPTEQEVIIDPDGNVEMEALVASAQKSGVSAEDEKSNPEALSPTMDSTNVMPVSPAVIDIEK